MDTPQENNAVKENSKQIPEADTFNGPGNLEAAYGKGSLYALVAGVVTIPLQLSATFDMIVGAGKGNEEKLANATKKSWTGAAISAGALVAGAYKGWNQSKKTHAQHSDLVEQRNEARSENEMLKSKIDFLEKKEQHHHSYADKLDAERQHSTDKHSAGIPRH